MIGFLQFTRATSVRHVRSVGADVAPVRMDGREELKAQVGELFRTNGGQFIRYWKRWVVESLDR